MRSTRTMIFMKFVLFVISTIFSISNEISDHPSEPRGVVHEPRRVKRVNWGEPLMDMNAYDVTHYLVHITKGNCASTKLGFYLWNLGLCEPPAVGGLLCGGALIKEYVVQTACHCIVFFSAINETHTKTTPRVVWEHTFAMYVGYFDIRKMKDGSRPTLFLPHQKCKQYPKAGITYDYGIIISKVPLIKQPLSTREAPVYAVSELHRLYQEIQSQQRVCLIAGWGIFKNIKAEERRNYHGMVVPQFLQHSWVRVMNYRECYLRFDRFIWYLEKTGIKFNLTYETFATWFCVQHFGKFRGKTNKGDSGSPVTCDNEYLGIVSSGSTQELWEKPRYKEIRGNYVAIRFTEHSNAAEFRRSFLTEVHTLLWRYLLGVKKKGRDRDFDSIPGTYSYMDSGSRSYVAACHLQLILISNFLLSEVYPVATVK